MKRWYLAIAVVLCASFVFAQCPGGQCPPRNQSPQWQPQRPTKPNGACPGGQCPNGQCPPQRQRPQQENQAERSQGDASQYPALVITTFGFPGSNENATGSGFIADREEERGTAIVITCAHGYKALMTVTVITQDGKSYGAKVLGVDSIHDLCIVRIMDPGITPMPIALVPPKLQDRAFMAGFAGGKDYMGTWGVVKGWVSSTKGEDANFVVVTCQVKPGCSGGPIMNEQGQVIAIVTGTFDGCTGPCLQKCLQFVRLSL